MVGGGEKSISLLEYFAGSILNGFVLWSIFTANSFSSHAHIHMLSYCVDPLIIMAFARVIIMHSTGNNNKEKAEKTRGTSHMLALDGANINGTQMIFIILTSS